MDAVDHRVHRGYAQWTRAHYGRIVADPAQQSRAWACFCGRQLGGDGFDQGALGDDVLERER
jgi:hypothetical protein